MLFAYLSWPRRWDGEVPHRATALSVALRRKCPLSSAALAAPSSLPACHGYHRIPLPPFLLFQMSNSPVTKLSFPEIYVAVGMNLPRFFIRVGNTAENFYHQSAEICCCKHEQWCPQGCTSSQQASTSLEFHWRVENPTRAEGFKDCPS